MSGLRISRSAGASMSPAVTAPEPRLLSHLDLGRLAVEPRDEVLQGRDDVDDVLTDAGKRRELVRDALDLDRGDRGALERREQHAAQRVAEGVAEAAVERLDHEDTAALVDFLVDDPRNLEIHQAGACSHKNLSIGADQPRTRSVSVRYFE